MIVVSSDAEVAGYAAAIAIAVGSLVIAAIDGAHWEKNNPGKLGFKWGYFFIFSTMLGNGLAFLVSLLSALDHGHGEKALFFAGMVVAVVFCAIVALQRRKWALVLTTLLSLNILYIVINFFYLRNRWSEFTAEHAERVEARGLLGSDGGEFVAGSTVERGVKQLSKRWRLALFCSAAWVLAVALFVFLFQPYGSYMRNDDMLHMLSVMFMPTVLALGLYWAYEKYIR